MNFQDIIREVYDGANKALKTTGTASAGQATVTPLQAWPDPKTYIGLVTVTGNFGTTGNVTLDPGSRTGILGNLTLSDPKGFIGLVTVVQSSSARTITGNITLSDAKTYVGLVTATIGNTPNVAVVGNVTLSDSKTYIGLVTATISNNATVFIGTPTLFAVVNTGAAGGGNTTLNPSPNYIGLVTAVPTPLFVSRVTQANASIGTTPVSVLASDAASIDTFMYNISNTTIFVSNATISCNASLGIPVFLNDTFSYSKFTGPLFASVVAGAGEVRFWRSLN